MWERKKKPRERRESNDVSSSSSLPPKQTGTRASRSPRESPRKRPLQAKPRIRASRRSPLALERRPSRPVLFVLSLAVSPPARCGRFAGRG